VSEKILIPEDRDSVLAVALERSQTWSWSEWASDHECHRPLSPRQGCQSPGLTCSRRIIDGRGGLGDGGLSRPQTLRNDVQMTPEDQMTVVVPFEALTPRQRRRLFAGAVLRTIVTVAVVVSVYYLVPMDRPMTVTTIVEIAVGALVVCVIIGLQIWRITRSDYPAIQAVEALAFTLPLYVFLFATVYYLMDHANVAAFGTPLSRTDAMYFSTTVFTTVGFGDITAKTEATRVLATCQMWLDVVIVGLVLRLVVNAIKVSQRRHALGRSAETAAGSSEKTTNNLAITTTNAAPASTAAPAPTTTSAPPTTAEPPGRQEEGTLVTLGAGTFTGGTDVAVGLYDVTPGVGQRGNFIVAGTYSYNEILGSNDGIGVVPMVRVTISKGDQIQISGLRTVTFTPVSTRSSSGEGQKDDPISEDG
jgi:voltage-gated potassium channel